MKRCSASDLVEGCSGVFCPSLPKHCCLHGIICSWWLEVVCAPLALQKRCQALEDLVVSPVVFPLSEAGLTSCQDVFKSCRSSAEVGSLPHHWWKFFGDGGMLCVTLMIKQILFSSIFHNSLYWSFSSPCFRKRDCLCPSHNLFMSTHLLDHQSDVAAFRQVGKLAFRPKPHLPCWTCPTMSLCFRADVACWIALDGVYFHPVTRGSAIILMVLCPWVFTVLTLEHLYSLWEEVPGPLCCRGWCYLDIVGHLPILKWWFESCLAWFSFGPTWCSPAVFQVATWCMLQ